MPLPSRLAIRLIPCLILAAPGAQAGLQTLQSPTGGVIVFGKVEGARSQAGAMGDVLRAVHEQCGERPKVGRPFQVAGTGSVAVFFTVTRRTAGNKAVAGLVIATDGAPGSFEAALVSDDAARFGTSVNPMIKQLFGAWSPGGPATGGKVSAPRGRPAPLHQVMTQDRSAAVSIPEGWRLDPQSGGGSAKVTGPQGQIVYFNQARTGQDVSDPGIRRLAQGGVRPQTAGMIVCPFNVDPVRAFPERFLQFYRLNGLNLNARNCRFDRVEPVAAPRGQSCVHAKGQVDPDGKGMREMEVLLSTGSYNSGFYNVIIFITLCPVSVAERERATMAAVFGSFQVDMAKVNQQAQAIAAPAIERIHAIGAAARANYEANNAINDRQHASWRANQDSRDRTNQGFHNYILDQTVIQDNKHGTHGTEWNATADALVRHDPGRFQYVQTPNYWKGVDY